MKVLLLNPPSFPGSTTDRRQRCTVKSPRNWIHPPIALAYLSSCLKKWNNSQVRIIDAVLENYDVDQILSAMDNFNPNLIISPIGSYSFNWDLKQLMIIKSGLKCKTVVFGEMPTVLAKEILEKHQGIDFCILGETELATSEIVNFLENKKTIEQIPGVTYRDNNRVIKANERKFIENLDLIPFPDRSLLKNEKYHCIPFFSKFFTDLTTSRGCPFNCKFCTTNKFWGKKFRKRSPENILEEIKECVEKFNIKAFFIPDETFTVDRRWVKEIIDGFKDLGIKWALQTRVDLVGKEILQEMADSGCVYIHYGAESGSQKILDYYQKGITVQQIKDAFKWSREANIETCATFIIGCPEETADSARATIELAKEIKADYYHFSPLIPCLLSDFFYEFKKQGILKHYRFEEYVKPNIVFKPKYLSETEIEEFLKKAYKETVMKPSYAFRHFWKVFKNGDLVGLRVLFFGAWWTLKTFMTKK